MKFPSWLGIKQTSELNPNKYNSDISLIRQWWDEHNSGARTWDNVNATNATITNLTAGGSVGPFLPLAGGTLTGNLAFNPTTKGIVGTATNDNAATGNVGEVISASQVDLSSFTSGTYANLTSVVLTAGDWDISASGTCQSSGSGTSYTVNGANDFVIATATASSTGSLYGQSQMQWTYAATFSNTAGYVVSPSIPRYRISISGSTTYYLNVKLTFTSNSPFFTGYIRARRAR